MTTSMHLAQFMTQAEGPREVINAANAAASGVVANTQGGREGALREYSRLVEHHDPENKKQAPTGGRRETVNMKRQCQRRKEPRHRRK